MGDEEVTALVLDWGSDSVKVGFAGEDDPVSVFPTVIGQRQGKERLVGQAVLDANDAELTMQYPMDRGVVTDWNEMESVVDHMYKNVLKVNPTKQPVLMTDTPKNPKTNREKMAQLMFEKFQVPALFISSQAALCLYASGRTTGTVLDIGSGVTTVVPVYEGYPVPESAKRMDLAGYDLTEYLIKLLSEQGIKLTTPAEKATAKAIKEKLCFVAQDYQSELAKNSSEVSYELPDKKVIKLNKERFQCPEPLFQPSLCGRTEDKGVHHMINEAISACEMDTRRKLYTNIILSGGGSMFDGMADRLKKELAPFGPLAAEAKISSPVARNMLAWSGGSVLASLPMFKTVWIEKSSYEESGPDIIHKKCLACV